MAIKPKEKITIDALKAKLRHKK